MIYLLVLILLGVAFTTATPVSTSFPVPSILTPHREVSPPYRATPRNLGFTVASASNWGPLKDFSINSSSYETLKVAPSTLCSIQNRTFWFAGQTDIQILQSRTFVGSSSSVAMALDFSHPSWIKEISTRPSASWPVIPVTPAEQAMSVAYNYKFIFHPLTHGSLINATTALQLWDISASNNDESNYCQGYPATTLILYTLDSTTNTLTVTRPAPSYQRYRQYPYGSFATLTVQGMTYLYALDSYDTGDDSNNGYQRDVHVAAAPASSIADKSTWKYYDNATSTWSSTEPLPTNRRASAAILTVLPASSSDEPFNYFQGGSIFFSEYHNAYLLIFVLASDSRYFRVRYAPTPLGPWSGNETIILDAAGYGIGFVYGLATPIFFQTDGSVGGKSLLLTASLSDGYSETQTFKVNFA
ncbi:hypothetical protein POJ06DRAFT_5057 [Lipomyces tetrasporus]|uniref:DUF4185 domain-containing protein n=1 Tax=Lipomyces tetrasporus TaxID=54092 RepID=A0AAD7QY63_9ASCO|nr:uncharacterized protein POJ06DRAFT_5057 [Lipomyces tetrasporus]KAJ8103604.1 hypothetical protein POJ06DRAFT_5057 [Lipomyces tetrasporus]